MKPAPMRGPAPAPDAEDPRSIERALVKLQRFALRHQGRKAALSDWAKAKSWWVVERSLAEAIHSLQTMRRAPGIGLYPTKPPLPPRLDPNTLDHFGVPKKA